MKTTWRRTHRRSTVIAIAALLVASRRDVSVSAFSTGPSAGPPLVVASSHRIASGRRTAVSTWTRCRRRRRRHRRATTTTAGRRRVREDSVSLFSTEAEPGAEAPRRVPSYRDVLVFFSTTSLVWLTEPVLSLVDTAVLGRASSSSDEDGSSVVVRLAALGPATMLVDGLAYLTFFLAVAVTNRLSKAVAENDVRERLECVSHALGAAFVLGAVVAAVVLLGGPAVLRVMLGGPDADPGLLARSLRYARIRACVAPLAVAGSVARSAALAELDAATPVVAAASSALVNVAGDVALCVAPLRTGVAGAAAATACATAASSATLLTAARRRAARLRRDHPAAAAAAPSSFVSFPDRAASWRLAREAGPILFVIAGKMACYSAMTLRAASFGVVPLACHNVLLRVFFFFSTFGDALSQTAETFLPRALYGGDRGKEENGRRDDDDRPVVAELDEHAASVASRRLAVVAVALSLVNGRVAGRSLRDRAGRLASDPAVSSMVARHAPWVGVAAALDPFVMLLEGAVIARSDLSFLVGTYGVAVALTWETTRRARVAGRFAGLMASLVALQSARLALLGTRVWTTTVRGRRRQREREQQRASTE